MLIISEKTVVIVQIARFVAALTYHVGDLVHLPRSARGYNYEYSIRVYSANFCSGDDNSVDLQVIQIHASTTHCHHLIHRAWLVYCVVEINGTYFHYQSVSLDVTGLADRF